MFPHNFVEEHNVKNIGLNDIEIGERIGAGGFGFVYKGFYAQKEVSLHPRIYNIILVYYTIVQFIPNLYNLFICGSLYHSYLFT